MKHEKNDLQRETGLVKSGDNRTCCYWQPLMPDYHDNEWGRPVTDDQRIFEKVCLESFHSGMSWHMIYNKRDNFRRAFADFDFYRVAHFDDSDIARLMADKSIVRNRAKILSAINNARRALELVGETGSLAAFFWQFEPQQASRPAVVDLDYWQANNTSPEAKALSDALKKRGWSWVGPVTIYALMQALGMVNDHFTGCCCREACEAQRSQLQRPVTTTGHKKDVP